MNFLTWVKKNWHHVLGVLLGLCLAVAGAYTKDWQMFTVGATLVTGNAAWAISTERVVQAIESQSSNAPANGGAVTAAVGTSSPANQ